MQQPLIILGIGIVLALVSNVESGVLRKPVDEHEYEKWTNARGNEAAVPPPKYKVNKNHILQKVIKIII